MTDIDIAHVRKALNDPFALWEAFHWEFTPQGHMFWLNESERKTLSPEAREILEKMIAEHEAND